MNGDVVWVAGLCLWDVAGVLRDSSDGFVCDCIIESGREIVLKVRLIKGALNARGRAT